MDATVATLRFGKHKGMPVGEVPTDYLAWVVRTFPKPPTVVKQELQHRERQSGASAILAASALSDRAFRDARMKRAKRHRRGYEVAPRTALRSDEQRQKSRERLVRLGRGVQITGEYYEQERAAWEATGGNPRDCPFSSTSVPVLGVARTLHS